MIDKISVVLPVFNEEENIENVLCSIDRAIKAVFHAYEIIIVNDGSTDNTPLIIERLKREYSNLKVISFEHNRGYGSALREGFSMAAFDHIFYTDSDGQFDVSEISKILPLIDKCDVVAGFRLNRKDSTFRVFSSRVYNKLVTALFGLKVRDVNCSFKLFKREIIDKVHLYSIGFSIDAELLWKAKTNGYKICETGVSHFAREKGESKVRITDTLRTVREMIYIKKKGQI